jgi:hypothetical protein
MRSLTDWQGKPLVDDYETTEATREKQTSCSLKYRRSKSVMFSNQEIDDAARQVQGGEQIIWAKQAIAWCEWRIGKFGMNRRRGAVLCRLTGKIVSNSCAICSSWRSIRS